MATSAVQAALARSRASLERGRGLEAVQPLQSLYRSGTLARDDEIAVRIAITEGYLLADDLGQATLTLGRAPESLKEPLPHATLSALWRLHGRLTFSKGDQSRAIALHTRALKFAELARDSRAIGLAHYELSLCYRQVGDAGILREHLAKAAAALHASGDKRHLALVHRLSGVLLGQAGRIEEAAMTFGQAERLATSIRADDVVASIAHNRANLGLITRRLDDAREHAERSVGPLRGHRQRTRTRRQPRHAGAGVRPARGPRQGRAHVEPRVAGPQPDQIQRDDGCGVRHPGPDPPDAW